MIYVAFFITSIIYSFAHQLGCLAELFSSIFNHLFLLKTLLEQNALISNAVVPGLADLKNRHLKGVAAEQVVQASANTSGDILLSC